MMQREFEFTLPKGWLTPDGELLRSGMLRLTTGQDELVAQADPRVLDDPNYVPLVLLSQVITRLGHWTQITPEQLETLFLRDVYYLQSVYQFINQDDPDEVMPMGEL
ncbi:hypothetical protein [Spirulina major]|uniref:hypothetical protein n=1 Tax=Spirulina major TaxID=270636 RepID=UPI000934A191|nr:hypothetical protein [Spirulina major]